MFDINLRSSFLSVESWLQEIRENSQQGVTIVVVANKTDINAAQVTEEEIMRLGLPYFLTSAKTGENVNDPFMDLSERVLNRVLRGEVDASDPVGVG